MHVQFLQTSAVWSGPKPGASRVDPSDEAP
jgi:hypothetical protein